MKIRFKISIVIISLLLLIPKPQVYGQTKNGVTNDLKYDTSKVAIIPLGYRFNWLFDSTYLPATLTQHNLAQIDNLLFKGIQAFNSSLDKDHKWFAIDFYKKQYKKQLIAAINKKGEKEVWINCFCIVRDDLWKTKIYEVADGGNCYFYIKVNLSRNKYSQLIPNSL